MIAENESQFLLSPLDDGRTWCAGHRYSKNRAIMFGLVIISSVIAFGFGLGGFIKSEYQMLTFILTIVVLISFLFWDLYIKEPLVVWYPETEKDAVNSIVSDETIALQRVWLLVFVIINLFGAFLEASKHIIESF
ncbi:MAG: hypothetical protein V3U87_16890 [Methylococcaceae bacterium]